MTKHLLLGKQWPFYMLYITDSWEWYVLRCGSVKLDITMCWFDAPMPVKKDALQISNDAFFKKSKNVCDSDKVLKTWLF